MNEFEIDVEFLLNTPGSAVCCVTEDEARQFISYLKAHYPKWCENWTTMETRMNSCESEGIGYTFYWDRGRGDWVKDSLMFGDISAILRDGYVVRDFDELVTTEEIQEGDQPIAALFGGAA